MRRTALLFAGLLASALSAPAFALQDLTGAWAGTAVCDNAVDDGSERTKKDFEIVLDDAADGTAQGIVGGTALFAFVVVPDPGASGSGRVAGSRCSATSPTGLQAVALTVKAKDGSDQGVLKGEMIATDASAPHFVTTCKLKLKRTATTIAAPIECPL